MFPKTDNAVNQISSFLTRKTGFLFVTWISNLIHIKMMYLKPSVQLILGFSFNWNMKGNHVAILIIESRKSSIQLVGPIKNQSSLTLLFEVTAPVISREAADAGLEGFSRRY